MRMPVLPKVILKPQQSFSEVIPYILEFLKFLLETLWLRSTWSLLILMEKKMSLTVKSCLQQSLSSSGYSALQMQSQMLWSTVVQLATPGCILMPSTVAIISVQTPRTGLVVLLPPSLLFQKVWKTKSTLNKDHVHLLISLCIFSFSGNQKVQDLPFCVDIFLHLWGVSCKSVIWTLVSQWKVRSGISLEFPVQHIYWCGPGEKTRKGHKPNEVNSSFHWWLDLPNSGVLLLAFHTFLWILFTTSWLIPCWKCLVFIPHDRWKFKVHFGKVAFNKLLCFL